MEVVHYQMVHHLQLKGDQAMNTQQPTQEQLQVVNINTEMQLMKQVVGIQIELALRIGTTLSSFEEVTITTLLPQVCFSIAAPMVAPTSPLMASSSTSLSVWP